MLKPYYNNTLKFIFFVICLFALSIINNVSATTYYVSPFGSDNQNGSSSNPFATIQKAANVVNPGDTVIVKDGTYTDTDGDKKIVRLTRSGASGKWITFKAENKWKAVLDGLNASPGTVYGFLFRPNVSYIRIENFEMKNMLRCIHVNNDTGTNSNIYIVGNLVHHTGMSSMYFWNAATVNNITVESNVVHNTGAFHNGDRKQNLHHGVYTYAPDTEIFNNIIYSCKAGWCIKLSKTAHRAKVYNNILDGQNAIGKAGQILIWHNPTDIVIKNNIFNTPLTAAIKCISHTSSTVTLKNNLRSTGTNMLDGCDPALFITSNNIAGNTLMVKPPNNGSNPFLTYDFSLQPNSPAIDSALATNISVDFNGNARPTDGDGDSIATYDIGAYEYFTGASNVSKPTGFKIEKILVE